MLSASPTLGGVSVGKQGVGGGLSVYVLFTRNDYHSAGDI